MVQPSVLDASVIESLMELEVATQTVGFMLMLIDSFLGSLPKRINELETAYKTEDSKAMHRVTHTLKGSAGNIGAMHLSNVSGEFGLILSQGIGMKFHEKYEELQREILRAKKALEELKSQL